MRPNYAMDAPPTEIEVNGAKYPCETDYRVWLDVLRQLEELEPDYPEGLAARMEALQATVFGGVLSEEPAQDVVKAIVAFSQGYPTAPVRARSQRAPVFSFDYDLNEIILAIRNQSGIDLSYRRTEPFHWWEFLLEFRTLAGEHVITNMMQIRGYKGKDRELKRLAQDYALPERQTRAERDEWDSFNRLFEEGDTDED